MSKLIEYKDDDTLLEGYLALPEKLAGKRPAVIVVHDWSGKNEFACNKADKLAELGYIGFALDMYGKGKLGQTNEEKTALMNPLASDRAALQQRILAAVETVTNMPEVDASKIAAIGFCFGGLCVLDLARTGADIRGVVSFHGLLGAADNIPSPKIKAKVLVLHGYDDPMCKPEAVIEFATEMSNAKADWQINMYGNTLHAFTNPLANDPDFGTVYDKNADMRSWVAMTEFFKEIL